MKFHYNHDCGGYDTTLGGYVNCLTEVGDPLLQLWRIENGKAQKAKYSEGLGRHMDDGSIACVNGVFTCPRA